MGPRLSILIPSITERCDRLKALVSKIEEQAEGENVEIVSIVDNRKCSVGEKRENLLKISHGEYVAYVDDDDDISDNYIEEILKAIYENDVDVITFNTLARINEDPEVIVEMRLGQEDEQLCHPVTKRSAWHTCAWKRELVKEVDFAKTNYGEDYHWVRQCNLLGKTEHHIDKILHYYIFDSKVTRTQ